MVHEIIGIALIFVGTLTIYARVLARSTEQRRHTLSSTHDPDCTPR